MDLQATLNPPQLEAVIHTKGPILILAGAGSGKTRVITYRIANLIRNMGVSPDQILAVTFTNKAAAEMKERVRHLIGDTRGLLVSTFHAACLRILRQHIHHLGYERNFVVYDTHDQLSVVKSSLTDLSINAELYPPKSFLAHISQLKQQLIHPDQYAQTSATFGLEERLKKVYALYQERLVAAHAADFDDLIFLTIRLLESVPEASEMLRRRFQYIMVDEYQDTNHAQYRLIRLLLSPNRNLCVVGDDDQSIYAFRGADVRNILTFERDFPDAKVVTLNQNYRSTQTILSGAASVISQNAHRKEKQLFTENDKGQPIIWKQVEDEKAEATFITNTISHLQKTDGCRFADFCVLYRTHAQSRVIEEALLRAAIPYTIIGGLKFYERKEIKDLIAYLRLILHPYDTASLQRVINLPPRGIGTATMERLILFAKSQQLPIYFAIARLADGSALQGADAFGAAGRRGLWAFYRLIEKLRAGATARPSSLLLLLMEEIHYIDMIRKEYGQEAEERIENILEFISAVDGISEESDDEEDRQSDLERLLDHIALVTAGDNTKTTDGVTLMTLHSAKGLEFSTVFLAGMEEKLFPHARSQGDLRELEEERRLCYVGMTRAKTRLYMTSATERALYGATQWNAPSRFMQELPPQAVQKIPCQTTLHERMRPTQKAQTPRQTRGSAQEIDFPDPMACRVGARVRHPLFGIGQVEAVSGNGEDLKVTVFFSSSGSKKLALKYAKLEAYP